jgi:betaine-aldehyde dehydrogenase
MPPPSRPSRSGARTTPSERQQALLKFADAVEARADELVALESENTGKIQALTASEEIPPMVDQIRFFAGAARVLEGGPRPSTWPVTRVDPA